MRLFVRVFLLLITATSNLAWAGGDDWRWIDHTVKRGQTLRLIALRYYGLKPASVCIAAQLRLKNPDYLRPGQRLQFLAPPAPLTPSEYRAMKLTCAWGQVYANGEAKNPFGIPSVDTPNYVPPPPPEPPPTFESKPLPPKPTELSTPFVWPKLMELGFSTGIAYASFRQNLDDSSFNGSADFQSLEPWTLHGRLRLGVKQKWWLDVDALRVHGKFIVPTSGNEKTSDYVWESTSGIFIRPFSKSWRARLGLVYVQWPVAVPLGTTGVDAGYGRVVEARVGLGADFSLSERWRIESALQAGYPVDSGKFDSARAHYILDGAIKIRRAFGANWAAGLTWQGRAQEVRFEHDLLKGQNQSFYSCAEIGVDYLF